MPATLALPEVSLTWLLQPYIPQATALLVALMLRLFFTLADVLWGLLGWGLSSAVLGGKNLAPGREPLRSGTDE